MKEVPLHIQEGPISAATSVANLFPATGRKPAAAPSQEHLDKLNVYREEVEWGRISAIYPAW